MIQELQGDKDLSRHRIIELDNGNRIHLERRDPYGFIHAWLDKGAWPEASELNGVFTSWERAHVAVDRYITERNAVVSEIRMVEISDVKETVEDFKPKATEGPKDKYGNPLSISPEITKGVEKAHAPARR